ncbi:PLP-dependent lyase/thiolase [Actinoallomurus iriomotensis]|uniref:PLP-dependent lyase/thiolase n=1 Tax=Actinoallomurus iriomotensis TaxID=478107 RepID=A0A9W6VXS9_9ACTN|nr:PLP-dependent lyase/thiolase [Actinoallomurus iriomotensis]
MTGTGAVLLNPNWDSSALRRRTEDRADIAAFHASLPGFQPTPLIHLPRLAAEFKVGRVLVKHEQERLGLPSFKIVGASWAVHRAVALRSGRAVAPRFGDTVAAAAALPAGTALSTATDGNHGRAIAHMARLLGLPCTIYVPSDLGAARVRSILAEGATVTTVHGSYDDTVEYAAREAMRHPEYLLVSDTSWPGYETIPAWVSDGYATIFDEAYRQLSDLAGRPSEFDIALVPAGVGAFASAAVRNLGRNANCDVITVEPVVADCVRRSLAAGTLTSVPGPHHSIMAGLNCGEVSRIAWPYLRSGVRGALAITDEEVREAMRTFADADIVSGESGAASLAGLTKLSRDPAGSKLLTKERTVLLLNTESATDLEAYRRVIASTAAAPQAGTTA